MTDETADARAALRAAGLRVTEQRLATLAVLDGTTDSHLTTEDVHARVARTLPGTPLQSVYLVLGALTAAGLVRRIEPAGSPARYERRIGDNHHHVVCTVCGAIEDVDCVVGHAPCLTPSDARGFTVTTAEVTFWGLCAACAAAEAADAPAEAADAPAEAADAADAADAAEAADAPAEPAEASAPAPIQAP